MLQVRIGIIKIKNVFFKQNIKETEVNKSTVTLHTLYIYSKNYVNDINDRTILKWQYCLSRLLSIVKLDIV